MKNISELSQAASLLANLGVVIGIAFLIIEIRQNDEMLLEEARLRQASAYMEIIEMYNEHRKFMASNPALTELRNRASREESPLFTETELSQLFDALGVQPNILHSAYRYWQAGHIPDQAWSELERAIEEMKGRDDLEAQIYMVHLSTMPDDMREYFDVPPLSELRIDRSKYIR